MLGEIMYILLIMGFMLNFTRTNTIVTVNLHNHNHSPMQTSGFPNDNHPFAPVIHFKETWEVFPAKKKPTHATRNKQTCSSI